MNQLRFAFTAQHPDHEIAQRLLPRGCGAVFSFAIKGSRAQGRKLIESLTDLPAATRERLLSGTALDFLGLDAGAFASPRGPGGAREG